MNNESNLLTQTMTAPTLANSHGVTQLCCNRIRNDKMMPKFYKFKFHGGTVLLSTKLFEYVLWDLGISSKISILNRQILSINLKVLWPTHKDCTLITRQMLNVHIKRVSVLRNNMAYLYSYMETQDGALIKCQEFMFK